MTKSDSSAPDPWGDGPKKRVLQREGMQALAAAGAGAAAASVGGGELSADTAFVETGAGELTQTRDLIHFDQDPAVKRGQCQDPDMGESEAVSAVNGSAPERDAVEPAAAAVESTSSSRPGSSR